MRSEYRGSNASEGSELWSAMAAALGTVGQATLRASVPVQRLQARLQDAGLRLCP